MSRQDEILEVLRNAYPEWITTHQIVEALYSSNGHDSESDWEQFVLDVQTDLEALRAADPPQVKRERRHDGAPFQLGDEDNLSMVWRRCHWYLAEAL